MIFARIGHGPCYYHWNEIFAGVKPPVPLVGQKTYHLHEILTQLVITENACPGRVCMYSVVLF